MIGGVSYNIILSTLNVTFVSPQKILSDRDEGNNSVQQNIIFSSPSIDCREEYFPIIFSSPFPPLDPLPSRRNGFAFFRGHVQATAVSDPGENHEQPHATSCADGTDCPDKLQRGGFVEWVGGKSGMGNTYRQHVWRGQKEIPVLETLY